MTATMTEMHLLNYGFEELSEDELQAVDGGATSPYPSGWAYVAQKIAGAWNLIVEAFTTPGNGYYDQIKKGAAEQGWDYSNVVPHI
jgi:bacteriocin-like protein